MKERTNYNVKKSVLVLAFLMTVMLSFTACQEQTTQTEQTVAETTVAQNTVKASMTITCAGVLDEMDKVPANKKEYIPQDGIMLTKENVAVQEGETVFNFLQRLCNENNIQMSYAEGMIYVTSLGNLNEKDCGAESGWMYKVNGESPSVGAAGYVLNDGDKVEFYYITSYAEAF